MPTGAFSPHGPIVVGVGVSVGGLPAFLDALPAATGMAFVVVTHLHPEYESHLAELLPVPTSMPARQVQKKTPIQENCVYVMPPTA